MRSCCHLILSTALAWLLCAAGGLALAGPLLDRAARLDRDGAVIDALVVYRAVLDDPQVDSADRAASRSALARIAQDLKAKGLAELAGEIEDRIKVPQVDLSGFPTRQGSESQRLFDSASRGTLEAPMAQLSDEQQMWRSLLAGATRSILSNASQGITGQVNRDIALNALVEGATGIDREAVRQALRPAASGDSFAALANLSGLIDRNADAGAALPAGGPAMGAPASASGSRCKDGLQHLASRFPDYPVPELRRVREAVLAESSAAALKKAIGMGYTPARAAEAALQSARAAEIERRKGVACIRDTAADPDAVLRALENGSYRFGGSADPRYGRAIHQACAVMNVVLYYTEIATRELALQMSCHAAANATSIPP